MDRPVFAVMALTPQHTYQVLTKRAERMRDYLSNPESKDRQARVNAHLIAGFDARASDRRGISWNKLNLGRFRTSGSASRPNASRRPTSGSRICCRRRPRCGSSAPSRCSDPYSISTSLSVVDLKWNALGGRGRRGGLDWVIAGGESGKDARDNDFLTNARSLLVQCRVAGVPFFGKQNVRKAPLPPDLLVRQWPAAAIAERHPS